MDEPMLRLWQGLRADPRGITIAGQWLSAKGWPASHARQDFYLDDNRLITPLSASAAPLMIDTPMHCGMTGGGAPEFRPISVVMTACRSASIRRC